MRRTYHIACCALLSLYAPTAHAQQLMDDAAMEIVTARGVSLEETAPGSFDFGFDGADQGLVGLSALGNAKLLTIDAAGVNPASDALGITSNNVVLLQDQAQQNLNALVNVNAASSWVQVLLNLNININSSVNTLNQGNTASLPVIP